MAWNSGPSGCQGEPQLEPPNCPPTAFDIYAQRVNHDGQIQWGAKGRLVCGALGNQDQPTIVSDGDAGAFITWHSASLGPVGVQHIDDSGYPASGWPANGVTLTATGNYPTIVSDDSLGAIVAWEDIRSGTNNPDIYAQRITAAGVLLWGANGVTLWAATGYQQFPKIVSDGSNGAIVAWQDGRNTQTQGFDIYVQRVTAGGQTSWTTNGVTLCAASEPQQYVQLVEDGNGGAIVTWQDERNGEDADIYAQRVNASGTPQWTTYGVALCGIEGDQLYPTIVSDGAHGAIVTWQDYRSGTNWDIHAQLVTAAGATWWGDGFNGAVVCDATGDQLANNAAGFIYPSIAPDGAGGAIVTWEDHRGAKANVYARRVIVPATPAISDVYWGDTFIQAVWTRDADAIDLGTMSWEIYVGGVLNTSGTAWLGTEGLAEAVNDIDPCTSYQVHVRIVSQDGLRSGLSNTVSGETCCTLCEQQSQGGGGGSRAQRLPPGDPLALATPRPNPGWDATEIRWSVPRELAGERFQLAVFDVGGRKVATVAEGIARAGRFSERFRPRGSASLESGVYFLRLQVAGRRLTRSLIVRS